MNHFCIGSLVCNIDSKFTSGHYSYDLSKTKIENVATVFGQKLNCRGRPPGEVMLEYITVVQTIKIIEKKTFERQLLKERNIASERDEKHHFY